MSEQLKTKQIEPTYVEENWSYVHLPNGDKLKYKHVVLGIIQQLDEKGVPKFLEDGTPMYGIVTSHIICGVVPKSETGSIKKGMN
jgi:hypothetical protein